MRHGDPAVTVALSVRDGATWLGAAIESVLAQTFGDFEFLILDDGSRDASADVVRAFAARDARVQLISRENRGLVASLNELLGRARAPLVARMDADDLCHPERFARQVAFLRANPDHGVVGTGEEFIDSRGVLRSASGDIPCRHEDIVAAFAAGGVPLSHPTVMFRRDLVRAVGGYRAAFRHCEDLDLWLRLAGSTRLANLPEPLLRYRRHGNQVSVRHAYAQSYGAAVARLAWRARDAGRPDPIGDRPLLPPIEDIDRLFGERGLARSLRGQLVSGLMHGPAIADAPAFAQLILHVRECDAPRAFLPLVPRLLVWGHPRRAADLARAILMPGRGKPRDDRMTIALLAGLACGPVALAMFALD
ncbi:MAG: glycosyltransferase [Novosphingobium sp.]